MAADDGDGVQSTTYFDLGDDELLVELAVLDAVRDADKGLATLGRLSIGSALGLSLERQALRARANVRQQQDERLCGSAGATDLHDEREVVFDVGEDNLPPGLEDEDDGDRTLCEHLEAL